MTINTEAHCLCQPNKTCVISEPCEITPTIQKNYSGKTHDLLPMTYKMEEDKHRHLGEEESDPNSLFSGDATSTDLYCSQVFL